MNILWLWLMWRRTQDLLDQIRRNQLTPIERAKEDREEEIGKSILTILILIPLLIAAYSARG